MNFTLEKVDTSKPPPETLRFKIWNHERNAWWLPDGFGYTVDSELAGDYSYESALKFTLEANRYGLLKRGYHFVPQDSMVPVMV